MKTLAENMDKKMEKLENWFKHQRKKEVLNGKMRFEVNFSLFYFFVFGLIFPAKFIFVLIVYFQ